MPKTPSADIMPNNCRVCGRPFNSTERCMSHGVHCKECCPGGVVTGKLPGQDRGELPFETEKSE